MRPSVCLKGHVIKEGWNAELDEWKSLARNSKDISTGSCRPKKPKDRSGITNLKVGFNNVFGYYFEVTNKYKDHGSYSRETG